MSLHFDVLRQVNLERQKEYSTCLTWITSQWLQALVGEVGEFANLRKKFERGDFDFDVYKKEAERELADIQIYLDLLAIHALDSPEGIPHSTGIDLGEATINKFNEVSRRVGSRVFID